MPRTHNLCWCFAIVLLVGCTEPDSEASSGSAVLRLAVTTSTRDSGLLDELVPFFEREYGVRVDVVAVGTGAAIRLGESGDVDVLLVHAREAEDAFLAAGHAIRREEVMSNTFEIVGPADDPAGIRGLSPVEAFKQLAATNSRFVSRGDNSGTHLRELKLRGDRSDFRGENYVETGQGMGRTLMMANEMNAYTLTDRGTYLRFRNKLSLRPLVSGGGLLRNDYGVLVVNPEKHPVINEKLAQAFADFLIAPETQQRIAKYRIAGEGLFRPVHTGSGS